MYWINNNVVLIHNIYFFVYAYTIRVHQNENSTIFKLNYVRNLYGDVSSKLTRTFMSQHALESGVRLMVDAEQTYFQTAISRLTLEMQRIYNREEPVIFNTYQGYLKVWTYSWQRHRAIKI